MPEADRPSAIPRLPDAELLTLARQGRRLAVAELWRRHQVYALAVARGLTPGDADGVSARAWAAIVEPDNDTAAEGGFRPYLYTAVRVVSLVEEPPIKPALLTRAFRQLTPRWREILWLTHVESMKPPQIQESMGLDQPALVALLSRARQGLRQEWVRQHLAELDPDSECHQIWEQSSAYARGLMTQTERAWMTAHLRRCVTCRPAGSDAITVASHLARVVTPVVAGTTGASALLDYLKAHGPAIRTTTPLPRPVSALYMGAPPPTAPTASANPTADQTTRLAEPTRSPVRPAPVPAVLPPDAGADDRTPCDPSTASLSDSGVTARPGARHHGLRSVLILVIVAILIMAGIGIHLARQSQDPAASTSATPQSGSIDSDTTVTFTAIDTGLNNNLFPVAEGTAAPGATLLVEIGDIKLTVTADNHGRWTTAGASHDGFATRGRIAASVDGGEPVAVVYDIAPPPTVVLSIDTSQTVATLTGLVSAGVELLSDGQVAATAELDQTGSQVVALPLAPGNHFLQVRYAEDGRTGPTSESVTVTVT